MIEPIILPGGTTVLVESAPNLNAVAVGFWFPVGSRTEAEGERGYSHFCEHMAFKGTENRDAIGIAREVDRVGGYLNAFTERETVCFHCTVPASEWRVAIDILADICFHATFPIDDFEREKAVVENEILAAADDPEECANDAFIEGIWRGDPIAAKIAGDAGRVRNFSRERLLEYFKESFNARDLVVSVAGPIRGEVIRDELLGRIPPSRGSAGKRVRSTPAHTPFRAAVKARIGQVYVYSGGPIDPPFSSDDFYALEVLNNAYGESMSSRLFQELRERQGLCYTVYSTFALTPTAGLWMVYAATTAEDFPRLLTALSRERENVTRNGISPSEISDSIGHLAGSFRMSLDDVESRMKRIARQFLFSGYALDPEETLSRIASVTKERVDAMTARVFGHDDLLAYGKTGVSHRKLVAKEAAKWKR